MYHNSTAEQELSEYKTEPGDIFAVQYRDVLFDHAENPRYALVIFNKDHNPVKTIETENFHLIENFFKKNGQSIDKNNLNNPSEKDILSYLGADQTGQIKLKPEVGNDFDEYFPKTIEKAITKQLQNKKENYAYEAIMDNLYETFDDSIFFEKSDILEKSWEQLIRDFPQQNLFADLPDFIDLINYNTRIFIEDFDSILNNYDIPLVVTLNQDYVNQNANLPENIENVTDNFNDEVSALSYIAQKQGYSKEEFKHILENQSPDRFLQSVREELINLTSTSNHAVALITLPFKEALETINAKITGNPPYLVIAKDTPMGLYDPYNGGGSLLNISAKHDMILPPESINTIAPDGYHGYSIKEIYGNNLKEYEPAHILNPKHELSYIDSIRDTISHSLKNGNSVLLLPREGVDYSSINYKPMTNINQLYFQQIRKNNGYQSHLFAPLSKLTSYPKNKERAFLYGEYSPKNKEYKYQMLFNSDQLRDTIKPIGLLPLQCPQPEKIETSNSTQLLKNELSHYFHSCFTGTPFSPDKDFVANASKIADAITANKIPLVKIAQETFNTMRYNSLSLKKNKNTENNENKGKTR
jgi:hypothetical protein